MRSQSKPYAVSLIILALTWAPTTTELLTSTYPEQTTITILQGLTMTTPINIATITHLGFTTAGDIAVAASNFDCIMVDPIGSPGVASVKAASPSTLIFGYQDLIAMQESYSDWATVDANESWFLHTSGGSRIQNPTWGWWLMDPASSGWRSYFVARVNSLITGAYDGVFLDDVWNVLTGHGMVGVQEADVATWHADVLAFLTYVKANITSGKLVVANSDEWSASTYLNAVDGECLEGFAHADWEGADTFGTRSAALTLVMIDKLATASNNGKLMWCASGIDYDDDDEDLARVAKYCYVAYLLGVTGSSSSCWQYQYFESDDGNKGVFSVNTADIGEAVGAYYQSGALYYRTFTGGKVVWNSNNYTINVDLGGTYQLLDGSYVTSVSLPMMSGEVLKATSAAPAVYAAAAYSMMRRR